MNQMKKLILFAACVVLYTSCATSQNTAIESEAEKKIATWKPLLELTDQQAKKLAAVETAYLKATKKLTYSPSYQSQLKTLQETRTRQQKEILSREQYLKLDLLESGRLKKLPPVRAK